MKREPSSNGDDNESPKGESGSVWTTYSDLLLSISIIFLVLFVFATLEASVSQIKTAAEKKQQQDLIAGKVSTQDLAKSEQRINDIDEATNAIEERRKAINRSIHDLNVLSEELKIKRKAMAEIAKDDREKTVILAQATETIREREAEISKATDQLKQLEHNVKKLQAAKDQAERKVAQLEKQSQEQQQELESLEGAEAAQKKAESAITKLAAELKQERAKSAGLSQQLASASGSQKSLQSELDHYKGQLSALKGQLGGLVDENGRLKGLAKELGDKVGGLSAENGKLKGANKGLGDKLGGLSDENSRLKGLNKGLGDKLGEAEKELGAQGKALGAAHAELAGLRSKSADCQDKVAELDHALKEKQAILAHTQGQLSTTQKKLDDLALARRKIASDIQDNLKRRGIQVDADPVSGTITLRMDETFAFQNNSYALSEPAMAALKQIIPVYAKQLFGRQDKSKKIASVTITGFASPRFRQQFVDISVPNKEAYEYNLDLSINRARQIAEYMFGEEIGDYEFKKELKEKTVVSGVGYMQPIRAIASEKAKEPCGPYDCAKSRRVEIKFYMNSEKGE